MRVTSRDGERDEDVEHGFERHGGPREGVFGESAGGDAAV